MHRLLLPVLLLAAAPAVAQEVSGNDYPTEARVEYVMACMASNGNTLDARRECSCSIDVIADYISYRDYEAVETAMAMQQMPGERAGMMRGVGWMKDLLERFRQAQVEADLECFRRKGE
ncbi:phage terminase family protein [Indioceanicola profundi]|uniref:phage terminase family protein n=1 Tax=Indioceanicola profundi TaxID=2220096 RepID=UPI001CECF355|nr:phage terminase family protein [Indioceanicola profundi]